MGGCCFSTPMEEPLGSDEAQQPSQIQQGEVPSSSSLKNDELWPFTKFFFSDLDTATKNFSSDEIVSENAEGSLNVVYNGRLENFGFIAVKRFKNRAWPDPDQFAEEAQRVGALKHKRIVNLIGYCCDGTERLLVAQFFPNDTLAKRLFNQKSEIMEWKMRLRVAYGIAEALEYCNTAGFASYNNLSAYTVLFDEEGDVRLSCFGLMKENMDDQIETGSLNSESVAYRFGAILVNLLTGKQTPLSHAPEMIEGKDVFELMDPNLEGKFSAEEATLVSKLASQCLLNDDRHRLSTKELVATLKPLQTKRAQEEEASSSGQQKLLEPCQTQSEEGASASQLMSLEEACSKVDLEAIHKILVMTKYKDDNEVIELSFQEFLPGIVEIVGMVADDAFENKNFETAIDCYTEIIGVRNVVLPSVYARRCLSYLFQNNEKLAHLDMLAAQQVYPNWPTGHYLMSVILAKEMPTESAEHLKQAILLEAKRQSTSEEDS